MLTLALAMKERIGWGTVGNIISIGLWIDLTLPFVPSVTNNFPVQLGMLLLAIGMMGLATALYISVNAGAGPRDSLMLGTHRMTGLSIRVVQSSIALGVVFIGWLLGGPVSWGTLVFAVLIGPAVQLGFRVFKLPDRK